MRHALAIIVIVLFWAAMAHADDATLAVDNGTADSYEKLGNDAHYIQFAAPPKWDHTFTQELSFYGYRYGDVGQTRGQVVIWSLVPNPDAGKPVKPGDTPPSKYTAQIHYRTQFQLSSVPDKPGWFSVPLDPVELPKNIAISLYTYSTDKSGVWIGVTPVSKTRSNSSAGIPAGLSALPSIPFRRDGRNWMMRLKVRQTLAPSSSLSSDQLVGARFAGYDDGTAEGFATSQKNGPMVRFDSGGHKLARVYVYAKLAGDWFGTDRTAGIWILDQDLGILHHGTLQYKQYTSIPSWVSVDIPDIKLSQVFYVLVEPVSRPQAELLIGYDSSKPNQASSFATAGSQQVWSISAPEESTNWMIRVEYK